MFIFFDLDDTLYDQVEPFRRAFMKNFSKMEAEVPIEPLYIESRKLSDEVFQLSESGQMGMAEMHIYRIKKALAHFGQEISEQEALNFQADYQKFQGEITLYPEFVEIFNDCLARKIILGIITNGPSQHQHDKIRQLGLEKWIKKDKIFISSEIGIAKPNPEIFIYVQAKVESEQRLYYVGDSWQNDILAANQAGWQTIWFNSRKREGADDSVQPTFTVENGQQLLAVIKSL